MTGTKKKELPWEEGLTPTQKIQRNLPEAISSFTVEVETPTGYSGMLTIRSDDEMSLLDRWMVLEMFLASNDYKPHQKYGKGSYKKVEKPVETVPGRVCPKCSQALVYFEKPSEPGLKHIKCSTQKWDKVNKRAIGCDYIEWANQNAQPVDTFPTVTVPAPPVSVSTTPGASTALSVTPVAPVAPPQGVKPASASQIKLIQDKWPTLYRAGMSMTEAYAIIKANFSK